MAKRRLHVDVQLTPNSSLTLDPDRSHYLCRVLRQRRGDHVLLFSGDGDGYDAEVENTDARACEVRVGAAIEHEPPPRLRLHLAQALIKGERLDFVMQKATELGVTDIWPLATERTEVHIEGHRVARREAHWQRIVESAAEQCGRLRLPVLHAPLALPALFQTPPRAQMLLLDPGAPALSGAPATGGYVAAGRPRGRLQRRGARRCTSVRRGADGTRTIDSAGRHRTAGGARRVASVVGVGRALTGPSGSSRVRYGSFDNCSSMNDRFGTTAVSVPTCSAATSAGPSRTDRFCRSSSERCTMRGRPDDARP